MGIFPEVSLCVGYELKGRELEGYEVENDDRFLVLYAGIGDPEIFDSYPQASQTALRLNNDPNSRREGAVTKWKVYERRFKEVPIPQPVSRYVSI